MKKAKYFYFYVYIYLLHSGFGEYGTTYCKQKENIEDLMAYKEECHELIGDEEPPFGENIKGLIHNEPTRVFVERSNPGIIGYFGLEE